MNQYPLENGRPVEERVHEQHASFLQRHLDISEDELEHIHTQVTTDMEGVLNTRGYTETITALSDIRFSSPGQFATEAYRALLDVPMSFGRVQAAFDVLPGNNKSVNDFRIVLWNPDKNGAAEITGQPNEKGDRMDFLVQQAAELRSLPTGEIQLLDEAIVLSLLHDFLLQANCPPSEVMYVQSLADRLRMLTFQANKIEVERKATYVWPSPNNSGEGEVSIEHATVIEPNRQQTSYKASLLSRQPLGESDAVAVTKLGISRDTSSRSRATLSAGVDNTSLAVRNVAHRNNLFTETIRQHEDPGALSATFKKALGRLANPLVDNIERG